MTKRTRIAGDNRPGAIAPRQVRLPGFVRDEAIGLGDVVQRATSYLGIRSCGGCEQRRTALNRWMIFTNGRRR